MTRFVPPTFKADAFSCPHCEVYSRHYWYDSVNAKVSNSDPSNTTVPNTVVSACGYCRKQCLWKDNLLIHPAQTSAPLANEDMPEDCRRDYDEARAIFNLSPRASAAMLRLALQRLCKHMGEKGENINEDIGALVKKGLPPTIKQALDVLRVTGNNAVHPGDMDIESASPNALSLFAIMNMVVERLVTHPRQLEEMYDGLPEGAKKGIEKRDKKVEAGNP